MNQISNEQLAEMRRLVGEIAVGDDPDEALSKLEAILAELQSRRATHEGEAAYWTNGNGGLMSPDVLALQDEETRSRFTTPLYLHHPSSIDGALKTPDTVNAEYEINFMYSRESK